MSSEIIRQARADGFAGLFSLKISAAFRFFLPRRARPAKKKLYSKPACGYFRGSELLFAGRLTALRPAGLEGRSEVMGLNKWLFDAVAAPYIDKAAEKAHAKFESDRELLRKDIGNIEKLLDRDRASLNEKIGNIEKLLDRDKASLNEKIGNIEKLLSNHVTETNDKIKELKGEVKELKSGQAELADGQAKLEVKIAEGQAELAGGQAKLEVKNAERHAELYKLLSSKSPDKKQ